MFELDVDLSELQHLAADLGHDQKVMMAAARTAAMKAARWARTQTQRGLSGRLGIPTGAVAKRATAKKRGSGARVWMGLNPLNIVVAKPSRTSSGLHAGKQDFHDAFIGRGRHSDKTVALRRKGAARSPLESVTFDVAAAAGPLIKSDVWPGLNAKFLELYKAELERRGT